MNKIIENCKGVVEVTEKAGDIHAKTVWKLNIRIARLRREGRPKDAEKLERFMNEYLLPKKEK